MDKRFPNKCCRCGYCCMKARCAYLQLIEDEPEDRCFLFRYNLKTRVAKCRVSDTELTGEGGGCDVRSTIIIDSVFYDFASLPSKVKKQLAFNHWSDYVSDN